MDEKQSYLPEDKDLLETLEGIGPMSTGAALSEQQRKIDVIHIKALLRSRKAAADAGRSQDRVSLVLFVVAMVQVYIALSQLLFDLFDGHILGRFATIAALAVGVWLTLRSADAFWRRWGGR